MPKKVKKGVFSVYKITLQFTKLKTISQKRASDLYYAMLQVVPAEVSLRLTPFSASSALISSALA